MIDGVSNKTAKLEFVYLCIYMLMVKCVLYAGPDWLFDQIS